MPEAFAQGVYCPGRNLNSVFSPKGNEFYFVTWDDEDRGAVMWMRRVDDIWTPPEPAPFNSVHTDNDACVSHDGQRLFFRSWRPLPGHSGPEERSYSFFQRYDGTRSDTWWVEAAVLHETRPEGLE